MMKRRAPRPKRDGRVTGTPRARKRLNRLGPNTPDIRPVSKRPTTTRLGGGTSASTTAKNNLNSAAGQAQIEKLKEAMKKKYASDRAGKARSTGTPKMTKRPATTGRMTRKPTAVGTPVKPKTATQQAKKVTGRRRLPTGMDIPKTTTRRTRRSSRPGNAGPMQRRARR